MSRRIDSIIECFSILLCIGMILGLFVWAMYVDVYSPKAVLQREVNTLQRQKNFIELEKRKVDLKKYLKNERKKVERE